jgi:hypothetical protein
MAARGAGAAAAPPTSVMNSRPFQLIELHSVPASQGRIAGYLIGEDQSAGMLEFCNQSWFCRRWRATASLHIRTMNAQI